MTRFHFAYPWFKTLHFIYLNFNSLPIRYPPLFKSGVKMYFTFKVMSLSSENKKYQKRLKQTRSKGGFVEKQDVH